MCYYKLYCRLKRGETPIYVYIFYHLFDNLEEYGDAWYTKNPNNEIKGETIDQLFNQDFYEEKSSSSS